MSYIFQKLACVTVTLVHVCVCGGGGGGGFQFCTLDILVSPPLIYLMTLSLYNVILYRSVVTPFFLHRG